MRLFPLLFLLLLTTGLIATDIQAQQRNPLLDSKHTLSIGWARQKGEAEVQSTIGDLPGISLNLDDLGVNEKDSSWIAEYRWRFKEKWTLVGGAFAYSNSGGKSAERDFNFQGYEFSAGTSIESEVDIDTYIVDVVYSAYRSEQTEIMVGGGLHTFKLNYAITGNAFLDGLEVSRAKTKEDVLAPLPNLRLQAVYAVTPRWNFSGVLGWLSLKTGSYDGDFSYVHARTLYYINDNIAASLGYQWTDLDLTKQESDIQKTAYIIDMDGPIVTLTYSF